MRMGLMLLIYVTGCGILAGCSSHAGKQISATAVDQFVKGKTTKADVLVALGPPQGNFQTSEGEALHYVFVRSGINGAAFVPIVGIFATKVTNETEMVTLNFDKAGIFRDYFRGATAITGGPGAK
jgi:outer membrane protein assembly factor BamE (lipoprotein component of BamABCDE complex)